MRIYLSRLVKTKNPDLNRNERRRLLKERMKAGAHRLIDVEIIRKRLQDGIYRDGILSLSEVPNNLLMWSHYADSHRGFCLGFLHINDFFGRALQVKYSDQAPIIDGFTRDDYIEIEKILTTKAKCWEYEKEWRIIEIGGANKKYQFPEGSLVAVFFGCKLDLQKRQKLIELIVQMKTKPALYQAIKKNDRFEIWFEPLNVIKDGVEIIPFMPDGF